VTPAGPVVETVALTVLLASAALAGAAVVVLDRRDVAV